MEEQTLLGIGSRVEHPKFGLGVVVDTEGEFYKVYFAREDAVKSISKEFEGLEVKKHVEAEPPPIDLKDFEKVMTNVFLKYVDPPQFVPIASKWKNGTLSLNPGDPELQGKEIPIDTFFHKIVMVRDRLRVLEQNINSHKKLDDADKVNLQQYITRIYGSLTTFNVLFSNKEYYFRGEGKS